MPRRLSDTQHFLELCRNTRKKRLDDMSKGMSYDDKVENGFVLTAEEEVSGGGTRLHAYE